MLELIDLIERVVGNGIWEIVIDEGNSKIVVYNVRDKKKKKKGTLIRGCRILNWMDKMQ